MKWLRYIWALIRLGRPHFLAGGVILYLLGVSMALYSGAALNVSALFWGQLVVTATQLMTHYANDYFDLGADQANRTPTVWSGGSRVLVNGRVPARIALSIALALAGFVFVANLILSTQIQPGAGTFGLLLLAQLLAWFYSAPPVRLHSRGIGELSTAVTVTLLTPLVGFYLQMGAITRLPVLAVLPLCCMQFAMLLVIEFPDAAGDRFAGKRTLVVRLGPEVAAKLYSIALLAAYAVLPLLWLAGLPPVVIAGVAALSPLALYQAWCVYRGDWQKPTRWNALSLYTIVLLMATALVEMAAFIWLIVTRT
ncbi:MAG: prenyltransferase [Anaerolineaceae bacterium]|nr:prenyltransferase [Anaerolineaceae bacterium]